MLLCDKTGEGTFQNSGRGKEYQEYWSKYWPLARKIFKGFTPREEGKPEHQFVRMEAYCLLAELIENENCMKRNFEDNEDRFS